MCGALTTPAPGQDTPLAGQVLYGINRTDATLARYDFDAEELTSVGTVETGDGEALHGIDGAAYVPGFQNLYAFWWDDAAHEGKLAYVDVTTAKATIVHDEIDGGRVTGATVVQTGERAWTVYAVQQDEPVPPFSVRGLVNINPNNATDMEFQLVRSDGLVITRADLHSLAPIDEEGTLYEGGAVRIRVRPKGNANQNELYVDDEPYPLDNSTTYALVGEMQVRVYNDRPQNGRAMGHWWLEITGGSANWEEDENEVLTPKRLVKVDHQTGEVTELFTTVRAYDSLATIDGEVFYGTHANTLYRLDPASETESPVGAMGNLSNLGMEVINDAIMVFETGDDELMRVDSMTATVLEDPLAIGVEDLGSMVFVSLAADPWGDPVSYD